MGKTIEVVEDILRKTIKELHTPNCARLGANTNIPCLASKEKMKSEYT
jgi:hypothetical protein